MVVYAAYKEEMKALVLARNFSLIIKMIPSCLTAHLLTYVQPGHYIRK